MGQRLSQQHNDQEKTIKKKAARTFPMKSSRVPTIRIPGSNKRNKQSGQAKRSKPRLSSNNLELSVHKRKIQKASDTEIPKTYVLRDRGVRRKRSQLFVTQTEPPTEQTEPEYHVTCDGIDEEDEHLEQDYSTWGGIDEQNDEEYEHLEQDEDEEENQEYIIWDGIDEETEQLEQGQDCPLCGNDLSYVPSQEDDYDYYQDYYEPPAPKLPEVSVLLCDHAFHSECLQQYTSEELYSEPTCILCLSHA